MKRPDDNVLSKNEQKLNAKTTYCWWRSSHTIAQCEPTYRCFHFGTFQKSISNIKCVTASKCSFLQVQLICCITASWHTIQLSGQKMARILNCMNHGQLVARLINNNGFLHFVRMSIIYKFNNNYGFCLTINFRHIGWMFNSIVLSFRAINVGARKPFQQMH